MSFTLIFEHLYIVLLAALLSLVVGLPLGVLSYLCPAVRKPIFWVADLLQTVPSLALLGIIMVFLGAGKPTVILGITLYSLLPIVRNTCLGLQEVPAGLKEAARGCGMSRMGQLFQVELPNALPMIFTGIRIAVVNAIGTAVFAALVGGGGLGDAIYQGIRTSNMTAILLPTLALMVIALLFDTIMAQMERLLEQGKQKKGRKAAMGALAAGVCVVLLAGSFTFAGGSKGLVMYDGEYSETKLLTYMAKLLVEEHTDLEVTVLDQMTAVNQFNELTAANPSCDMMVSYDGTVLTTFLHLDTVDIPEGMTLYDFVNQTTTEEYGVYLLDKLGIDNTYAIAVTNATAEQYGLETVSDLIPVAGELIFGAEHGFFTQEGSMKYTPFVEFYGLDFKAANPVDINFKYTAIANDNIQVTEVYATDGLNSKADLKILEDDKSFFPEYNGAYLVRADMFEKFADEAPNLKEVLNMLGGVFTNEIMTELTYYVDVEGRTIEEVATEFLQQQGMIS